MISCALTYETLLAYTDGETRRWHDWFREHPPALTVPFAEGGLATVGGLLIHIFGVELRYAERLLGRDVSTYEAIYSQYSPTDVDNIFALGDRARGLLVEYLERATMEDMREVLTFQTLTAGTITASKYKIASNIFLHGIRHWGQIATVLRQAGYVSEWGHDMLLSSVVM